MAAAQAAKLNDAYDAGKKVFKKGINAMKTALWSSRYKILLIGETGSGKTSFLNLICNYNLVQTLGFQAGIKHFHAFHKFEFKSDTSKMESKTNNATMYEIDVGNWAIGVIDTPGFSDSRGLDEDENHVKKIVEALEDETYINCVCLVINGRAARYGSLKYVLSEVTAILPKSVVDNVIVVFTNTTSFLHLTFDISELKKYFGCEINLSYCIDNPYCLYEKAIEDSKELTINQIAEGLKNEFEKTAKVLERMFTAMKDFQQVHTNDFMRLYNKKQEVERSVLVTLIEYDNQKQLEKQIKKEKEKLSAAIQSKSFHEKFESIVEIIEPVSTNHHNTICGHPGCYSNCHVPCNDLDEFLNKEAFLGCWCIDGETCHVCGHDYRVHYHDEMIFEKKTKKAIDEKTKKKYEAAKNAEDKARIQKQQLEQWKIECEKEKKRLSQKLVTAMEEFETLGITRSYLILLENQLFVIEMYLKAEGNKAPLQKTKADLEKRITVVKESIQ